MALAAVVSLVATTKPSIEAAPASAPLPNHHDQRGRHSRRTSSRTMTAIALRMPATASAGQAIHLIKRPPVLQSTAQRTRRTAALLRAAMTDALLLPRRGQRAALPPFLLPRRGQRAALPPFLSSSQAHMTQTLVGCL